MDEAEKTLLSTMTGEHFQPVRLHYKVLDRAGLLRAFEKLRCVDHDPTQKRWVWLYSHEAKKLRFKRSYAEFPTELHPIVIGSFFLRANETLLLDLRSCERALLAIPFFDANLPRRLVTADEAEIVNQLFPVTPSTMKLSPDALFDAQASTGTDPDGLVRELTEKAAGGRNPIAKLKLVMKTLQDRGKQPLPEIERLPVHYATDGMGGFTLALRMRQMVAMQGFLGNTQYTLGDAIREATSRS